jgi:Ni/Fe-hydrogenase subunit HybB-like protein
MHHTSSKVKNKYQDLLIEPTRSISRSEISVLLILAAILLWGVFVYLHQVRNGLGVSGMNRPVYWGVYIVNFVFFIGLAHSGTFISAILRLLGAEWRVPLARAAEAITIFSLPFGAGSILIDMGRIDRMANVLSHGRFMSPILWDVTAVTLYMFSSVIFFYLSLLPDIAIMRDTLPEDAARWRRKFYTAMALGWQHSAEKYRRLEKFLGIMAIFMSALVITVHTVVSFIFAMLLQPGWHTAILGPFFLVGAIYSGSAATVILMAALRWKFKLQQVLSFKYFDYLRKLLISLALAWSYFMGVEHLTAIYGNEPEEMNVIIAKFFGEYSIIFWIMVVFCLFIPLAILLTKAKRSIGWLVTASIIINIGMWLERYIVIVPTETFPRLGYELGHGVYLPTFAEISITAGCFAGMAFLYMIFTKLFPMIPIWETAQEVPGLHGFSGYDDDNEQEQVHGTKPAPAAARGH